jgi:hypothetical protein
MRTLFIWAALACVVLSQSFARAEEQTATQEELKTQVEILKGQVAKLKAQVVQQDAELYPKYIEAKKQEYDYQIKLMKLNLDTFETQWLQTYTVMALVALVVVAGVCFSAFQLWRSIGVAGVQLNSELEMSARNVRVTSSVVGVVVLVISIGFLYIYTHEVYQLRFVNPYTPDINEPKR